MAKEEISLQDYDFGFTAVDETELEAVTVASHPKAITARSNHSISLWNHNLVA